jgi:hypothetical protein
MSINNTIHQITCSSEKKKRLWDARASFGTVRKPLKEDKQRKRG